MEDNFKPSGLPYEIAYRQCARCQADAAEPGYANAFCRSCRVALSKHPIPKWIWLFAAGIFCVMIAGIFRMPTYFNAAVHMGRAENALDAHKYKTAQKELDKVLAILPQSQEAHCDMLIASCYSMDLVRIQQEFALLRDKVVKDQELYKKVETATAFINSIMPDDTAITTKVAAVAAKDSVAGLLRLADTIASGAADMGSLYMVADRLFDMKAYDACDTVVQKMFAYDNEAYMGLHMMAAIRRQQGRYDDALNYCKRVLASQPEDASVYAQMAKIEMKRKNDQQAAAYIRQGKEIDAADLNLKEAEAILAHVSGRDKDCNRLLAEIKQEEPDPEKSLYHRAEKIINGTEQFR